MKQPGGSMGHYPKRPSRIEEAVRNNVDKTFLSKAGRKGAEVTNRNRKNVQRIGEVDEVRRLAEAEAHALEAHENIVPVDDSPSSLEMIPLDELPAHLEKELPRGRRNNRVS